MEEADIEKGNKPEESNEKTDSELGATIQAGSKLTNDYNKVSPEVALSPLTSKTINAGDIELISAHSSNSILREMSLDEGSVGGDEGIANCPNHKVTNMNKHPPNSNERVGSEPPSNDWEDCDDEDLSERKNIKLEEESKSQYGFTGL